MTDYTELVKKLRDLHRDPRPASAVWLFDNQIALYDAAAAIEELQKDLKACRTLSKCRLQGWKENEMLCEEQAKTLESIDVLNKSYLEKIRKLEQQLPKRGKWVEENRRPRSSQFVCSECHRTAYDPQPTRDKAWRKRCRYAYCPNCGAKMEVQE